MSEISDGLVRFTAVVVQTVACLLLYFLQRLCFVFNSTLALYKIVFLLVIFIVAMAHVQGPSSGLSDFNEKHSGFKSSDALSAMLTIVSSYVGWDGANYVSFIHYIGILFLIIEGGWRDQRRQEHVKMGSHCDCFDTDGSATSHYICICKSESLFVVSNRLTIAAVCSV